MMSDVNKWEKFDELSDACFYTMISSQPQKEPWIAAFHAFQDALDTFIKEDAAGTDYEKSKTLWALQEDLDNDIAGWLVDFLDELDMHEDHSHILEAVEYLRSRFDGLDDDDAFSLRSREIVALAESGQALKAYQNAKEWKAQEPNNPQAAAMMIFCCRKLKAYEEAQQYIDEWTREECNDENYVVYAAAENLYEEIGDKENYKKMKEQRDRYDDYSEQQMMNELEQDYLDSIDDEDLPFS